MCVHTLLVVLNRPPRPTRSLRLFFGSSSYVSHTAFVSLIKHKNHYKIPAGRRPTLRSEVQSTWIDYRSFQSNPCELTIGTQWHNNSCAYTNAIITVLFNVVWGSCQSFDNWGPLCDTVRYIGHTYPGLSGRINFTAEYFSGTNKVVYKTTPREDLLNLPSVHMPVCILIPSNAWFCGVRRCRLRITSSRNETPTIICQVIVLRGGERSLQACIGSIDDDLTIPLVLKCST